MLTVSAVPLALLLCVAPQRPQASDFAAEVEQASLTYDLITNSNASLLLEGDLDGATRKLLAAVPEGERTAAHAFVLGNLLFPLDFEQSYRLHQEAFAKDPQNPMVMQEWALEQHRAGQFAEAEALYVELLALGLGPEFDARCNALRADCLLHLERPEEACAAWRAADAQKFHTQVEEAAAWVYTPVSPETRRCALLQRARGTGGDADAQADARADPSAFDDLLLLDLHWDQDLWNVDVNTTYTAHDLALAQQALGADTPHFQTLAFLARWTSPGRRFAFDSEIPKLQPPADNSAEIRAEAEALRVIGGLAKPPESSRLASHVFQILIDNEVVTAEELLGWHEVELRRRAKSSQGDVEALRVLLALYEQTWHDELDEFERFGWTRYGDLGCALSQLAKQRDALRPKDLMLVQALSANRGDVRLCRLAADAAEREGELLIEPISRLTMAEFAQMEECQRVNQLFRKLEAALRDRK